MAREILRERRQHARPALEQNHARLIGVDVPELAGQRSTRDQWQHPGELHAGRSAANHDERQQSLALGVGRCLLRALEREQKALAHHDRVVDALEPRCNSLPLGVTEVRVP